MKDIKGYEGLYAVTSCGRVWSHHSNKFLQPRKDKDGYLRVGLYKDGEQKTFFIHRLVAEAYIPNPDNLPLINHKSEVKTENFANNLEWCDKLYNNTYGSRANGNAKKKPIYCLELDRVFDSASAAAKELVLDQGSIIKVCQGKRKTHGGYHWRYVEEVREVVPDA